MLSGRQMNREQLRAIYRDYLTRCTLVGRLAEKLLCESRPLFRNLHVTKATDLVIEGYPRSGANYAANLIRCLAVKTDIRLSFRRHTRSQIRLALAYKTPVVILLRNPKDLAVSYMVATGGGIGAAYILRNYNSYYGFVSDFHDRIALVEFDRMIHDPSEMLRAVRKQGVLLGDYGPEAAEQAKQQAVVFYQNLADQRGDENLQHREAPIPTDYKREMQERFTSMVEKESQLLTQATERFDALCKLSKSSFCDRGNL